MAVENVIILFISFGKRRIIGQKVDTWLRIWNFINQRTAKQFNHAHFWELYGASWKLISTHNGNSWKCGILKQIKYWM